MIIWYKWYHRNFTEKAANMIVSREGSSKFNTRSSQKHRVARGFLQISQKKLPNGSFRASLLPNFTEEARKSITCCGQGLVVSYCLIICCGQGLVVSYCLTICCGPVTPDTFQKDRFVRCFQQFSQKKLPKRSFRARLLRNFTAQTCKTSVSRDASDNFHKKSFQNDRFVRGFLEISQNKLPKRSFRARLPRNFTEQASRTIVSRDTSDNFRRKYFQNNRFVRGFLQI